MTLRLAGCMTSRPQPGMADDASMTARTELPATLLAARRARRFTRRTMASWQLSCGEAADLIVSELVTNAIRHASAGGVGIGLRLELSGTCRRIEVRDAGPRPPQPRVPAGPDESGSGLVIVEALASRWGSRPMSGGKGGLG
jgi:anti-sigma regulatory factor (Ser/Thr protein kinase)